MVRHYGDLDPSFVPVDKHILQATGTPPTMHGAQSGRELLEYLKDQND